MNYTSLATYSTFCGKSSSIYDLVDTSNFNLVDFEHSQANFTFRFLGKKTKISSFALETPPNPDGCYWSYPTTFKFYGTNDFENWKVIFEGENSDVFSKRGVLNWINLGRSVKYCAYRFESFSKDRGDCLLGISRFEIDLSPAYSLRCSNRNKSVSSVFLILFLLVS